MYYQCVVAMRANKRYVALQHTHTLGNILKLVLRRHDIEF